ncbi:hypothetical protein BLNAU_17554 [Blattamonas nauphoetae]|uniref:Uncharacterized protein n=1 Tax=Blattamonas nauphoetae TaxID=2049346 RepID=A0ABQ9X6Y6_9EUKA|nr:hypothetical protein BLNAU_17554 [Blattamonas nauphoetae]
MTVLLTQYIQTVSSLKKERREISFQISIGRKDDVLLTGTAPPNSYDVELQHNIVLHPRCDYIDSPSRWIKLHPPSSHPFITLIRAVRGRTAPHLVRTTAPPYQKIQGGKIFFFVEAKGQKLDLRLTLTNYPQGTVQKSILWCPTLIDAEITHDVQQARCEQGQQATTSDYLG